MGDARFDFEEERFRHGQLFGREDVLDRLSAWLVGEQALHRGWVLLMGSPGVGKSAIVNRLLETLPGPAPHHFIRRGNEGWDRPEAVVQSLCDQIEQLFPEKASAELPSEVRLGDLLKRVSKNHLVPREERLIVLIDGLDEAASDSATKNPLPRFLPRGLPQGIVILCASRPMHPHLEWFAQLDRVHRIDLDHLNWATSNEAACRAFWAHHAPRFEPPLDAAFVEEAVRRAEGNLLHAIRLRDWLEDQPPERRLAVNIPQGLSGFLTQIWINLRELDGARLALVMKGLGFACAAREALPAYLFGELFGGSTTSEGEEFLRVTRPFLLEEPAQWHSGKTAYRPFHEYFRASIVEQIGDRAFRAYHRLVEKALAPWPPDARDPARRLYALRHAVAHRIEAGDLDRARRLCADVGYLEAKCEELGVPAIERDIEAAIRALGGTASLDLAAVLAAVIAEASRLHDHPGSLPALLYNRLRCAGWSAARIERVLRFDGDLPPLRLLHGVRLGPTLLRAFVGHDKPITACVATPDGSHILSASADHTLRLWALGSGECVAVLRGHKDELTSCAITPDGKTAISTAIDATVRLWDLASRRCIDTLDNDGRWATTCAVTPDGQRLVVGSDNGAITIWDLASRRRVGALAGHSDYVTACLVTPLGQLVSASRDRDVRVWDLVSGDCEHTLARPASTSSLALRGAEEQGWITALALLPGGKHVIATAGDGAICRWDLASGQRFQYFGAGQGRVDACALLHEGRHLLCGMADGTLVVWDLTAEQRVCCLPAHAGSVSAGAATRDGRRIFSASSDRTIRLWELGGPESLSQDGHAAPVTACALTADGRTAVSASEDRTLKVWDVTTGACRVTLERHPDLVTACAISADGRRVISGARDGSVRVWLLDIGGVEFTEGYRALVSGCAILPDGQMVTASQDGALKLRSPATLEEPTELGEHGGSVDAMAITPDGTQVLSISRDGTAKLWDVTSRRCTQTLRSVAVPILSGALTPDGRRAVLARQDGKLEVYDLRSRQIARVIQAHEQRVFGCTVTPDGARVITVSEDGTLRVFSLETGECLGTLRGASWFRCVATSDALICAGDQEGNLWMIVDGTATPAALDSHQCPPRRPRLKRQDLARLRDKLARLYGSSHQAALLVVREAGLDETRLNLTGSAGEIWHSILDEASKQSRLDDLVRRALEDYSGDLALIGIAKLLGIH